ncbi:putative phage protein (predicted DNA packaging) [Ruminiclostridium sufflavum DSM 19573]|uniref:Putative phage protein (Predicted DNA packaging) n=1 Tax=Ruminiclostridium sufflavum DSM 19573 TaxID=1121337 RepID=A0A318Y181_9FIRM|nr:head-tail connector protein [Ruminiclostridium sufflavum]PYG84808.1 putative phage protein (predicted DNA packaging) [Ruminiclostridium sufflavum DSM 19573]
MIVSLEETKIYLRIDGDEENTLVTNFISTAEELCEGVLRFPLSEFAEVPETVRQAVLYLVASMYEMRETINMKEVMDVVTRLLFTYRRESW